MKLESTIDLRKANARRAKAYLQTSADFFALYVSAGVDTLIGFIRADELEDAMKVKANRRAWSNEKDGLRWKGLQVMHLPTDLRKRLRLIPTGRRPSDWQFGEDNTRSADFEREIVKIANQYAIGGTRTWTWTARKDEDGDCYKADATADNGLTIEGKFERGRF